MLHSISLTVDESARYRYGKRRWVWLLGLSFCFMSISACSRLDLVTTELEPFITDTSELIVETSKSPYRHWTSTDDISITQYAPLGFSHQSSAAYGDYAFFVTRGRSKIGLYNLKSQKMLFTLALKGVNGDTYHCNQSTFGFEKYDSTDAFPLLYISQRAKSNGRCFIEAYRLNPLFNEELSDFESFSIELVQTIYLPEMTYENSMGNANCVMDASSRTMFTYSRNNNINEDNYGQCKITQFTIPDIYQETVILGDEDIVSAFMIDASAINMQGGCIQDGVLYIGQGYWSAGYIYLNIIDLEKRELVRRFDLREYNVTWEPEGCFFYDGSVMLAHANAISRIEKI